MNELIEQLEKSAGPDLYLDHAIAEAVRPADGHGVLLYTASIDAALTLVPEGLDYVLRSLRNNAEARVGGAKHGYMIKEGQHPVPAIALCIAALRARAALTADKRQP